jgi:uncharacterized phage protein (TIGR01671 family)
MTFSKKANDLGGLHLSDFFGVNADGSVGKDFENIVFLQFTGLKDKNGREIFEGDVVVYEDTESEYVDVGIGDVKVAETAVGSFAEVKFDKGAFGLDITQGEILKYHRGFHSFEWLESEMGGTITLEVIGNIYESPELLSKAA